MRICLIWTGLLTLGACGSDLGESGSLGERTPCTATAAKLTLRVEAVLPDKLGKDCAADGAIEAFLLVPGSDPCGLTLEGSSVSGCCGGVERGQNPYVDLYFREATTRQALGMQSQLVYLPNDSEPVVDLDFSGIAFNGSTYDSDGDGIPNIDEFCVGTL